MKVKTLIIGGGLAGLSCARELSKASRSYLLVEKERETGGLCRSVFDKGFTFDYTGHFLHFQKNRIQDWVLDLVGGKELKLRARHAAVYSHGTYSEYPYQENNAGLPSNIIRENVLGYMEAALFQRFSSANLSQEPDFKSWCLRTMGPGISKNFMYPYNEKLWKIHLSKLTPRWMGRFVPTPRIREILEGAMLRRPSSTGYNASFLYPDQGGISVLPRAIARNLPNVWRGVGLQKLDLPGRKAVLTSGLEVKYENLVSSIPLPRLVALAAGMPTVLARTARNLQAASIYNINFGIRGKQPIPYSWVYFPEKEFGFHRAGSVSACVPTVAPKGNASIYVEFSYRSVKPNGRELGRHAIQKLRELGWIKGEKQIVTRVDMDLPGAYVIYDQMRDKSVPKLLNFLQQKHVFSIGRYGRWEYGSMESAMEQGIETAREILRNR